MDTFTEITVDCLNFYQIVGHEIMLHLLIMLTLIMEPCLMNSIFRNPDSFFRSISRPKRYVTYPAGTAIGLLVAIALPVEVPEENLYFSLNFEANYNLPDNITQYYNSDIAKVMHSVTRRSTYNLLENQLSRIGYNGVECLLRMICETAAEDLQISGLVEDLFFIIFRPSQSQDEGISDKYIQAEKFGSASGNCTRTYTQCHLSLLDLFSTLKN